MATGDSNDILTRVKMLIPFRWFAWVAPLRDAILGGLSDSMAWCYQWIVYAKAQSRIATSTGPFLDLIAYDFLGRHLFRSGMTDDQYRARILSTILQERVTRKGMSNALDDLTGAPPIIFEPWNTGDAGAWCGPTYTPACGGTFAWANSSGVGGAGAWGSTDLPAQFFLKVTRTVFAGVPIVGGLSGLGTPVTGQLDASPFGFPFSPYFITIGPPIATAPTEPSGAYANMLTESTSGPQHAATSSFNFQTGITTFTGDFSAVGARSVYAALSVGSYSGGVIFDLTTGVASGGTNIVSSSMLNLGGGWYRCSVSFSPGIAGAGLFYLYLAVGNIGSGYNASYTGDGVSGVKVGQMSMIPNLICGAGAWEGSPVVSGGVGAIEWFGAGLGEVGITNQMIYDTINTTRPTGSIAWTQID